MHEVTLTVAVPDGALEHVLDALHREGRFMHEVGLASKYSIRSQAHARPDVDVVDVPDDGKGERDGEHPPV